jgi:hypothetical protein
MLHSTRPLDILLQFLQLITDHFHPLPALSRNSEWLNVIKVFVVILSLFLLVHIRVRILGHGTTFRGYTIRL